MKDCLVHANEQIANEQSIANFRAAYDHQSPLDLGYVLLSMLNQKSTNPLIIASKQKNSEVKFAKWENIIKAIIGELQLLEGFASGLLFEKNSHDWDRLEVVKGEIYNFIDQYKDACWEDFKTYFKTYIETHTKIGNWKKADELKEKLDVYGTGDSFYVCVMNEDKNYGGFYCHCPNAASQLIELRGIGQCNAFVYRSIKGNKFRNDVYENIKAEVNNLMYNRLNNYEVETLVQEVVVPEKLVRSDGFVCMVYARGNVEIRSANCPDHKWGPGWWNDITRIDGEYPTWKLIVGLP